MDSHSKKASGFRGIYCPIPSKRNPYFAEADKNALTWAESQALICTDKMRTHLRNLQFPDFIARAYPEEKLQVLQILVDWGIWIAFADDQQDIVGADPDRLALAYRGYIKVLQGTMSPDGSPMQSALFDLRDRILLYSSQASLKRLIQAVENWFASLLQECKNRAMGYAPDLFTYIELRNISICMHPYYALHDLSYGAKFPDVFWHHPTLQEQMRICANIIAWSNDVFSCFKERELGDPHNMVLILERDWGYSTEQAIDETIRRHNAEMELFLKLDSTFANKEPVLYQQVSPFIGMLRNWIRASLDWSCNITTRYDPLRLRNFCIFSKIEDCECDRLVSSRAL